MDKFRWSRLFHGSKKKSEVLSLWQNAGIADCSIPFSLMTGFGQIANGQASCFTNFPSNDPNLAHLTMQLFAEAAGVYRRRCINAINPFDWIPTIVDLPKRLLGTFGIYLRKGVNNFLRFIWCMGGGFGLLSYLSFILRKQNQYMKGYSAYKISTNHLLKTSNF